VKAVFLRALEAADKAAALLAAIHAPESAYGKHRFELEPACFAAIPRSPFAYWVGDQLRSVFTSHPTVKERYFAVRGAYTTDDFKYFRLCWEVHPRQIARSREETRSTRSLVPLAKGGSFSPYYYDIHLLVRWSNDGQEAKVFLSAYRERKGWGTDWSACLNGYDHYFRPGLTWPRRTNGLSFRAMPSGCIFADKGPAVFVENGNSNDLLALASIANSRAFAFLVSLQLARTELAQSYEVGLIQRTPIPNLTPIDRSSLAILARRAWSLKRGLDTRIETSHAFLLPALSQAAEGDLVARAAAWAARLRASEAESASIQAEVDARCIGLYGIEDVDQMVLTEGLFADAHAPGDEEEHDTDSELAEEADEAEEATDPSALVAELVSWTVGVAFGRFDLRLATGARTPPVEPDPFDPLPACSPGMLTGEDGLPLDRAPPGYPLDFPEHGVLVDDPGHPRALTASVHDVFRVIFRTEGEARWDEATQLLAPGSHGLRGWMSNSLFEHHLKRHSKSRRKAPILWQISLPSGRYSVWLYAHCLTRDSFFEVQNDVIAPKLVHEERQLAGLRAEAGDDASAAKRREVETQERLVEELRVMLDEVRRVAPLWNPSLDDGVVLTMAALWRLVPQHKAWQRELKTRWDELVEETHEWAHVAMHLWPERVVPKCATDRSLAIAHALADAFWVEDLAGRWRQRASIEATIRYLEEALLSEQFRDTVEELRRFAQQHVNEQTEFGWWVDLKSGRNDDTKLALALWPERVLGKARSQPGMLNGLGLPTPARGFDDRALAVLLKRHKPRHNEGELDVLQCFCDQSGDAAAWKVRWADFDAGRLDDQPLARFIYPQRVVAKAIEDHAFAAAHDLARWFWRDTEDGPRRLQAPDEEIAIAVAEREKPAVKAALKALIEAPAATSPARRERRAKSA
jgi:hypothetical protein